MPDEYLPPNKILFLHNVPDRVSRDDLDALFRRCVCSLTSLADRFHMLTRLPLPMHSYSGLVDVRTIPGRSVAFVEFTDSVTSAVAKDALNGHAFSDTEKLRITFAK